MKGKYFTLDELTRSDMARRYGIDNVPDEQVVSCLESLVCHVLDPVREMWGNPITVNSGYRCSELNGVVGGKRTSQHLKGEAADITTGSREDNRKLFFMIGNSDVPFDQLIDESDYSWIHVSFSERRRGQILHL